MAKQAAGCTRLLLSCTIAVTVYFVVPVTSSNHLPECCKGTWGKTFSDTSHRAVVGSEGYRTNVFLNQLRGGGGTPSKQQDNKAKRRNNPTDYRLFISNLPRTLDDEGLREAFERFGTIEEAKVMRDIETGMSRRMGYVSFKESTAVYEAIEEMHEMKLCAADPKGAVICTKLNVAEAKPMKQTW